MHPRRLSIRIVATLVAVLVATWSTALCVSGMMSRHVSHACCAKIAKNGAGRTVAPGTCCAENTDNFFAAVSAPAPVPPPSVAIVMLIADEAPIERRLGWFVTPHRATQSLPGAPTYLLVSSFRL
jgi:hypothetical protein